MICNLLQFQHQVLIEISQFKLKNITTFTQQFYNNMARSDELKLGMYHLKDCLDLWLNENII